MNSKTFINLNPRFSSDDGCQNTENFVSLTDSDVQKFLEGKKTKIRKEKPKVTYSVALVMVLLAAENENWRLEDLSQADFGRATWKQHFLMLFITNLYWIVYNNNQKKDDTAYYIFREKDTRVWNHTLLIYKHGPAIYCNRNVFSL